MNQNDLLYYAIILIQNYTKLFFPLSEYFESAKAVHWYNYETARGPYNSHRIVEVSHHPGSLARGRITEAGVVGITDDALYPGQCTR